jgi:hypothetical protein
MTNALKHGIGYVVDNTDTTGILRIEVNDPDNAHNVPIYDGPAGTAWKYLIPGIYDCSVLSRRIGTITGARVIITQTASYVVDADDVPITDNTRK